MLKAGSLNELNDLTFKDEDIMQVAKMCGLESVLRDFEKAVADARALIAKRKIKFEDVEAADEILRFNSGVAGRIYGIYIAVRKLAEEKNVPFYPRNDPRIRKLFDEAQERDGAKELIFNHAGFDAINAWYIISRYNARVVLKYFTIHSWD